MLKRFGRGEAYEAERGLYWKERRGSKVGFFLIRVLGREKKIENRKPEGSRRAWQGRRGTSRTTRMEAGRRGTEDTGAVDPYKWPKADGNSQGGTSCFMSLGTGCEPANK